MFDTLSTKYFKDQQYHFFPDDFGVRAVREAREPDEPGRDGGFDDGLSLLIDPAFESRLGGVCAAPMKNEEGIVIDIQHHRYSTSQSLYQVSTDCS